MFETAAACPPGLEAVHMYRPESDTLGDTKLILFSLTIKRSESEPAMELNPLTQPTLGSGNPVTSQVIMTGVPVSVVTLLPIFAVIGLRIGSNTSIEMFDESIFGKVGSE